MKRQQKRSGFGKECVFLLLKLAVAKGLIRHMAQLILLITASVTHNISNKHTCKICNKCLIIILYVVVNFLSQIIFVFRLFLGMYNVCY